MHREERISSKICLQDHLLNSAGETSVHLLGVSSAAVVNITVFPPCNRVLQIPSGCVVVVNFWLLPCCVPARD